MAYIYRIYTEEKNKRDIVGLASQHFESFTLQPMLGYYQGKSEKSIIIEFLGASERAFRNTARFDCMYCCGEVENR